MNVFKRNSNSIGSTPIRIGKPQALTLTTDPKKVVLKDLHNQFQYCLSKLAPHLEKATSKWKLYPELNGSGGLHWHGIIVIKNKVAWYHFFHWYSTHLGFVLLKDLFDINTTTWGVSNRRDWTWYIQKDWPDMCDALGLTHKLLEDEAYEDHINRKSWKRFCGLVYIPLDMNITPKRISQRILDMRQEHERYENVNGESAIDFGLEHKLLAEL